VRKVPSSRRKPEEKNVTRVVLKTINLAEWGQRGKTAYVGAFTEPHLQLFVSGDHPSNWDSCGYFSIAPLHLEIFGAVNQGILIRETGAIVYPRVESDPDNPGQLRQYALYVNVNPWFDLGFLTVAIDTAHTFTAYNW